MKKMKALIIVAVIALLSFMNYVWAENLREPQIEEPLKKAFEASGAQAIEVNMNVSGAILDQYLSKAELRQILDDLKQELQITGEAFDSNRVYASENDEETYYKIEFLESQNLVQAILWGKDHKDRGITVILSTYEDPYEDLSATDLVIDIAQGKPEFKMIKEKVKKIFDTYNSHTKITSCIIGTYDAKLEVSEKKEIISEILKSVKGKKVEDYQDAGVISVSAYAPVIDDHIFTAEKKMNLNIALRYNDYENKTYIWIATPIIAYEY